MNMHNETCRRAVLTVVGAVAIGVAASSAAIAQENFPNRTIEVVIHSNYGGGTDTTARMMMIRTRRELETDMVVIARRGGAAANAQAYVLDKPADGHTVMALTQTHLYTMARGQTEMKIGDIIGVARAMDDATLITVAADSPFQTLDDLIQASRQAPLNWGVAQVGGTEHIGLALFAKESGIQFKVVPFGSGAQMVQALMAGAIDATLPNVSEALIQVQDGTFRALAVMAEQRLADFPDVPSTYELGYEAKTSTTRGYAVRADTPPEIVQQISEAMVKAMNHDTFTNYLGSAGLRPEDSVAGWEVWDQQLKEEYAKAAQALEELGLL